MLARWWGDLILRGPAEWELLHELHAHATDAIIGKTRYSAFFAAELDNLLRKAGVADLIIIGVLTNCCCETTAPDAFVRDYRVFFVRDATATATEDLHVPFLKNLPFGFAYIVSTEDLLTKMM